LAAFSDRQALNQKRERALRKREEKPVDINRILARGDCLSQLENDLKLVRDPQLYLKWTPIFPHPLPIGYELFDNERELQQLSVLPPEKRIMAAAAKKKAWCVEELFAQGHPVNTKDGTGFTALHLAATNNDAVMVKVLLNMKADANATNVRQQTHSQ
ncbi:unnamed protein product, partial [Choristocarpus tenellus]